MHNNRLFLCITAASTVALGACVAQSPSPNVPSYSSGSTGSVQTAPAPYGATYGSVTSIEQLRGGGSSSGISPVGTVIGAVVGGVIGSQIGEGRGRTAATVAGAAGGALAGNAIGQRTESSSDAMYRINMRLDNGGGRSIDVSDPGDLRVGDRVRIDGNQISRY